MIESGKSIKGVSRGNQKIFVNLIHKQTQFCLKPESRPKKNQYDPIRIMGGLEDAQNLKNLWILQPFKGQRYEIIHFQSDFVLDSEDDEIRIDRGKQKISQFFYIETVRQVQKGVREQIRIKDIEKGCYLVLDGVLMQSKTKDHNDNQIFVKVSRQGQEVINSLDQLKRIFDPITKDKYFDVEEGSLEEGAPVILFKQNMRANQYWVFKPPLTPQQEGQNYSIQNYLSKMYLDIKNGEVLQTQNPQKIWQLKKKHDLSGELYHTKAKRYVIKGEQGKLGLQQKHGQRWQII